MAEQVKRVNRTAFAEHKAELLKLGLRGVVLDLSNYRMVNSKNTSATCSGSGANANAMPTPLLSLANLEMSFAPNLARLSEFFDATTPTDTEGGADSAADAMKPEKDKLTEAVLAEVEGADGTGDGGTSEADPDNAVGTLGYSSGAGNMGAATPGAMT